MDSLHKKRAALATKIWRHERWREDIRKKFAPVKFPFQRGSLYHQAVAPINKQLKLWYRQIKKYDMIKNKIMFLGNAVAMFTGINPKGLCKAGKDERAQKTLMLFYRKGIELGIEQKLLREYVGMKRVLAPAEYRKKHLALTNNIRTTFSHVAWLEWKRFNKFYDEWPVTGSDYLDLRKVVA